MKRFEMLIVVLCMFLLVNCQKENEPSISYPKNGMYGVNLLDTTAAITANHFISTNAFSLAANLGKEAKLKIVITALDSKDWSYDVNSRENWMITDFDMNAKTQTFTAINDDARCDLKLYFMSQHFKIEYYEMQTDSVSYTRVFE